MKDFQKNKNILLVKGVAFIIAVIVLINFNGITRSVNNLTKNLFYTAAGSEVPDSSIVLITITENDIEKLGSWPLKRSYYALAISNLNKAGTKRIGLEVFLSEGTTLQSVYNELLTNEIEKSGNVVLGSLVSGLQYNNGIFHSDSMLYPSPKIINNDIATGHLNYVKSDGIYIPEILIVEKMIEPSFSYALLRENGNTNQRLSKTNFNIAWDSFTKYSLLEFFEISENSDSLKNRFADKIVLIGVSDPSRAKTVETAFDNNLPGIAVHATALNNLIKDESLNEKFLFISAIIFLAVILIWSYSIEKINIRFSLIVLVPLFIILSYFLLTSFCIELNYSAFIIPLIFVAAAHSVNLIVEKNKQLISSLSEADILKAALRSKEENLKKLQSELKYKNDSPPQELLNQVSVLKNEIEQLKKSENDDADAVQVNEDDVKNFFGLIYKSKTMQNVVSVVEKVAPQDATVLITGESGSGKELIANAIHQLSPRKNNNFIAVNCAALSDTLLESELFGHVKGAFTNAVGDKIGRFEAADKGTIFLDEIGETSENFQTKLLRVIQSGEFQKVGAVNNLYSDVRIVAATNKNLEDLVNEKKFREDLYYRLNVIKVYLPPLKERKEDLEPIVNYFVKRENENISVSKSAMKQLRENEWKGNVRELESVIKRACIFASAENRNIIKLADLPGELVKKDKSNLEGLILESLREKEFSHTSINETAKELGNINRTIVSENFRGIVFKNFFDADYDIDAAVIKISDSEKPEVLEKVESKLQTYMKNIKKDLEKLNSKKFEDVKEAFSSKYKNLPQKYHFYLDEIIRNMLSD